MILERALAHNPASTRFRSPAGAVACGAHVRLRLGVLHWAAGEVAGVRLALLDPARGEGAGGAVRLDMARLGEGADLFGEGAPGAADGGRDGGGRLAWFGAEADTCGEPRVLRYRFEVETADGRALAYAPRADGRSTWGQAYPGGPGAADAPWFQLTVYDPAFETPPWAEGTVMYQVFPDRFARGADEEVARGAAAHRRRGRPVRLHASWDEPVCWEGGAPGSADAPGAEDAYDPVDFFGGTLPAIEARLPYLASLGVGALYLNPICEARSNHRYDTADYLHVDPLLGGDADFERLCAKARGLGIRVVCDAVLSHTGADSVYFNREGAYEEPGAWQAWAEGAASPYAGWYDFDRPNGSRAPYRCWWGDPTLPEVDERNPSWQGFMLGGGPGGGPGDGPDAAGRRGALPTWLARGASGFRLDVADELPDDAIEAVRRRVKESDGEAVLIGEVWEDPTTKESYGRRRTYALGRGLDSVMNYPLRDALLGFALGTLDAQQLAAFLDHQRLDYPPPMYRCLMNLLSSHDVERVRTVLGLGRPIRGLDRAGQLAAVAAATPGQDERGARLQGMLAALVYCLPGMPCLYYGDELGMTGGGDPFDRATFPSSPEAAARRADVGHGLVGLYRWLGALRGRSEALRHGDARFLAFGPDVVAVVRAPDMAALARRGLSGARLLEPEGLAESGGPGDGSACDGSACGRAIACLANRGARDADVTLDPHDLDDAWMAPGGAAPEAGGTAGEGAGVLRLRAPAGAASLFELSAR